MDVNLSSKLSQRPARIFVDATYTLASGKNSGIERVVRNLLQQWGDMACEGDFPHMQQVVCIDRQFYPVAEPHIQRLAETAAIQSNVIAQAPPLYRRAAGSLCSLIPASRMRKWLLPQTGHLGVFKLPHSLRATWDWRQIRKSSQPVRPGASDLLVLPDAYWINRLRANVWPAAASARRQGTTVATLLYDLIPLTHPQFVGERRRDAFLDYLKKAAMCSDLLVAISKTVRDEVTEYLSELPEAAAFCKDTRSIVLGSEIKAAEGKVREPVKRLFRDPASAPYLMVATFDPRKNHNYLLDAFDLLWRQHDRQEKLCLVGRIGARCQSTVHRIFNHPEFNKKLFLFDDLSDAELHHCYSNTRGVIFPSIVEGFGLPIVESLWYGNKTMVSDTPIHREVGGEDCVYFSLESPANLVQEVLAWEQEQQHQRQFTKQRLRKPTTWRETSEQMLAHCYDAFATKAFSGTPFDDQRQVQVA